MIRTIARRGTATLAMAGLAAFGAATLAPAASAAAPAASAAAPAASAAEHVDGSYKIIKFGKGNGPDAFLVTDKGREPVFFCDADKPKKRHNNCIADPTTGGPRF